MDQLIRFRQRFWAKVDTTPGHGPKGDCWIWTASKNRPGGYGQISRYTAGRYIPLRAHVASYEMHKGPTNGLFVCHRCDNPPCVNPEHLFLGTAKDNSQDAKNKGRSLGMPRVITDARIEEIRKASGRYAAIASRYNISAGTVSLIKNRNYPHKEQRYSKRGRPPKLSLAQVQAIQRASGLQREIAQRFGISQNQVSLIKRGLRTQVFTDHVEVVA